MHLLSKSTYMRGKQCPKNLWLYKYRAELRPAVSVAQQAIFTCSSNVTDTGPALLPKAKGALFGYQPDASRSSTCQVGGIISGNSVA